MQDTVHLVALSTWPAALFPKPLLKSLKEAVRAAKAAGLTALTEGSVVELRGDLEGRVTKGLTVEKTRGLFNDFKKSIPDFTLIFDRFGAGA